MDFIRDIRKKACNLITLSVLLKDQYHPPEKEKLQKILKEHGETMQELIKISDRLKDRFSRDLKFANWKYGFIWKVSN